MYIIFHMTYKAKIEGNGAPLYINVLSLKLKN